MYDAIIIGARVAGSSTGMLLARKGYRVLIVDRASFPSDTLSTHQIQLPGVARLKRWGLLDKVIASNAPAVPRMRFDAGFMALEGSFPVFEGVNAIYGPRRTCLDKIMVDAALDAGAELRENFVVDEVLVEGDRVAGIRGHARDGQPAIEKAAITIGADGRHSLLAGAVKAPIYDQKPALTCTYYSYFSGIPLQDGEIYSLSRRAIGVWPTNDGLVMIVVIWPAAEFNDFRADVEKSFMSTLELVPGLADRVHAGRREERIYGTADTPNFYRKPFGQGWALVGDAGYIKDPITAQGISDAFRDAELLAEAVDDGFSGRAPLEASLAAYETRRNEASHSMYQFTTDLAALTPPPVENRILMSALRDRPDQVSQFFGVLTGAVPAPDFFNPSNIFRIIGLSGMARVMVSRLASRRQKPASQPASRPSP